MRAADGVRRRDAGDVELETLLVRAVGHAAGHAKHNELRVEKRDERSQRRKGRALLELATAEPGLGTSIRRFAPAFDHDFALEAQAPWQSKRCLRLPRHALATAW
jgi:hypothetical protein